MDPPFPHFMFGMLSAIRDKGVKSYPVKKVGPSLLPQNSPSNDVSPAGPSSHV